LGAGSGGRDGAKDESALSRTAKSCGPDIPTLISSLRGDDLDGDGGKKARLTKESAKETVKTIRAGNAGIVSATCGELPSCVFLLTRETAGAFDAPGIPCALYVFEGRVFARTRVRTCRGKAKSRHCEERKRRSNPDL
jgi:hypothetical protein